MTIYYFHRSNAFDMICLHRLENVKWSRRVQNCIICQQTQQSSVSNIANVCINIMFQDARVSSQRLVKGQLICGASEVSDGRETDCFGGGAESR